MSRYYVIVRRLHLQKYSFQKNSKQFESDCLNLCAWAANQDPMVNIKHLVYDLLFTK